VISFYDPNLSYEENFREGPFGELATDKRFERKGKPETELLGKKVWQPFGIPAGPLINGKYVKAALDQGFDICVYKTVRTRKYPCHPKPNVLAIHVDGKLTLEKASKPLVADNNYQDSNLGITNSFGVPSPAPDWWQEDMAQVTDYAKVGQMVWGSFQATTGSGGLDEYLKDWKLGAKLVAETGVPAMIANLSCPNEGTGNLLCFDVDRVRLVVETIKDEIGEKPLLLKLAYFDDEEKLRRLVGSVGKLVQGLVAINTIAAPIVDERGKQALPGEGRGRSGVCGSPIKWAGLEIVERLVELRDELGMNYLVIGVGGVTKPNDYGEYRNKGADAVLSATGAMWNSRLAREIWNSKETK